MNKPVSSKDRKKTTTKIIGGTVLDPTGFIVSLCIVSLGILLSYILEKRHILGKKQES
jgi:hypothetical protein